MKIKQQRPSSAAKERTPSAQAACLAAVQGAALERVSALLREGVAVNWQDKDGCSFLFHAIFRRHFAIAEELLARGANIDLPDQRGWTPLFWAAFNGHMDIVGFLVVHHADANAATHEGDRPLFMAFLQGLRRSGPFAAGRRGAVGCCRPRRPRCTLGCGHKGPPRDRETA